ncbi:MAG: hypothetical protein ACYC5A_11035 [Thermoleophilia bacterium]
MSDSGDIISILRKYYPKANSDFSIPDYMHAFGRASEVLLYVKLFMPELVEINDSVLLAWNMEDPDMINRFKYQIEASGSNRQRVEASFNLVEVGYLFDASGRDTSDDEDEKIAHLLADAWRGHIKLLYPNRNIQVEVLSPEQTGSTVGLHFFEIRK